MNNQNGSSIKDWPEDMRPREKLLKNGEHTLSDAELLAVLLRTGHSGRSAVDLGRTIMQTFKTFREMSHTDVSRWRRIKGIGNAKITQIRAAVEIGRRFLEEPNEDRPSVRSPQDIADMFMPRMRDLKIEVFKVALLDGRNNVMSVEEVTAGTPTQAVPHVRDIMSKALSNFASGIVCVHNHPSCTTAPSREDRRFTEALRAACDAMELQLVDHIIIGDNSFFSFAEGGF